MKKLMQSMVVGVAMLGTAGAAYANPVGVWQTEATDAGDYLHVTIEPCGDMLCGTISKAFNGKGEEGTDYEHLGRKMIWDMKQETSNSWRKGKIWAPDQDETYAAQMELKSDGLSVSGCFLLFCRSQLWTRVSQ